MQQLVDVRQFHAWIALEVAGEDLADEFHVIAQAPPIG
jgi:hypothetical protein